jgi:phenylacetate-CoA ligase
MLRPVRAMLLRSPAAIRAGLGTGVPLEATLTRLGEWRLATAYERARRTVPAYRTLARESGSRLRWDGWKPDFSAVPVTDKPNYVQRFSIEERCQGGRLPDRGVTVDESSGTSGMPNNWVRGAEERADMRAMIQATGRVLLGDEPIFVINAFALGPWATGMAISMALADGAIVKSTGPEIGKIQNTLNLFGPRYRYLICGYPPFLKRLVDAGGVDWQSLNTMAFCGGEGMSEGLRTYLERSIGKVYSSFGAGDLEINVAAENDFTVGLRRRLLVDDALAKTLRLPDRGMAPMVFQYNPLDYYIESNGEGELIVSVTRPETVSPKLRYNIHDLGAVRTHAQVVDAVRKSGGSSLLAARGRLPLPFLFLWGRSDSTVAFYGCNVTPASLEEVTFSVPALYERVDSFALLEGEDVEANKTLAFAFELKEGAEPPQDVEAVRRDTLARLTELNQDYREAARIIAPGLEPTIEFHQPGTGPFANYDIRLKRKYIQQR